MTTAGAQLCSSGIVSPAPVAHSEEQRTFNPRVRRSKLRGGTTNSSLAALPQRMRAKVQPEAQRRDSRRTKTRPGPENSYRVPAPGDLPGGAQ